MDTYDIFKQLTRGAKFTTKQKTEHVSSLQLSVDICVACSLKFSE